MTEALDSSELLSDLLHALFDYEDGKLYRKGKRDKEAGAISGRGYRIVSINYRKYMVHRLVWIMHGNKPVPMLDHIDGNKLNNCIENLRPATKSQNMMNVGAYSNNTSGIKGVSWSTKDRKWIGQVWIQGRIHCAGSFHDIEKCAAAVRKLREDLHGEFARHE
jgi:hypothetical protein